MGWLTVIIIGGAIAAAVAIYIEYKLITSDAAKGYRYKVMSEGEKYYKESLQENEKKE